MADGIIYLDIDDEITSAAARIRGEDGRRVAVVLPYGSRVATSRINFRLLARDALTHEKRLSIVAADAAARALAASAGLPVFASVSEYETSLEPAPDDAAAGSVADGPAVPPAAVPPAALPPDRDTTTAATIAGAAVLGAAAGAGAAGAANAAGAAGATSAAAGGSAGSATAGGAAAETGVTTAATAGAAATAGVGATAARPARPAKAPARTPTAAPASVVTAAPAAVATEPVSRPGPRAIGRTPILIGIAVLALAAIVGGVGAYLLLPSATATVTAREEAMTPLPLQITASTTATEPDAATGVVPAEVVTVDLEAADTFAATGKRVEEAEATGTVRFRNKDFLASENIPKGAIVSTQSGVRFRTNSAVTVPRAELVGLTIVPAAASVKVTAVDPGPEGNVEPNTILVIPRGEDPLTLDVTNPEATGGGKRDEFPRVVRKDVEAAVATLTERLTTAFTDRLDDPDLTGSASTAFPETGVLGAPVFSVDPETLVGQEVESFDLGATASGTVTAVDTAPITAIAEERLTESVPPGYQLVEGSSDITVDPAVVSGGTVTFPVVATARQVAILDPEVIEAQILGRPVAEARTILESYGIAELTVWPDWVGTIPTIEGRVDVIVNGPLAIEDPSASPPEPSP